MLNNINFEPLACTDTFDNYAFGYDSSEKECYRFNNVFYPLYGLFPTTSRCKRPCGVIYRRHHDDGRGMKRQKDELRRFQPVRNSWLSEPSTWVKLILFRFHSRSKKYFKHSLMLLKKGQANHIKQALCHFSRHSRPLRARVLLRFNSGTGHWPRDSLLKLWICVFSTLRQKWYVCATENSAISPTTGTVTQRR